MGGGLFGYRFDFPPMRVGRYELFWHRPMVAYQDHTQNKPAVLADAPLGYLTVYPADKPDLARPVELWPRLLHREPYLEALELFQHEHDPHYQRTALNVRLLLDTWHLRGERPLPRSLARQILIPEGEHTLEAWLASLPDRSIDPPRGRHLVEMLERCLEPERVPEAEAPADRTYTFTAKRSFEVRYWKKIAFLSEGKFINKCNADYVHDTPTEKLLAHFSRDLEPLGDYLLRYYRRLVAQGGPDRQGAGRRPAVSVADGLRFQVDGRLAEKSGSLAARARPHRRHPRPRPGPGGHHGRPLRHGLHAGSL